MSDTDVAIEEGAGAAAQGVDERGQTQEQVMTTTTEVPVAEPPPPLDTPVPWPWVGLGVALLLGALASYLLRGRRVEVDDADLGDADVAPGELASSRREAPPAGLGAQLRDRLGRTRSAFRAGLDALLGRDRLDDEALEALEDALLLADVGVETAERLVGAVRSRLKDPNVDEEALRTALRDEMLALLRSVEVTDPVPRPTEGGPFVLLVVGVNGSGKTTTIGKLATRWTGEGRSVILGAADTYRAAASDQLAIWAERAGVSMVRQPEGADPAAVAYQTVDRALADGSEVAIIDTAGRLQNARPLMEQLTKIRKVLGKKVAGAPHETWLVVDGTMGQNALQQARAFHEVTPLTGVVVTKLDGTAKGGMVLAIAQELGLPVRFIGVGEQQEDLRPFAPEDFVDALW